MKIVYICSSLDPAFVAGAVRYNRNVVHNLSLSGNTVTAVDLGALMGRVTSRIPAGTPRRVRAGLVVLLGLVATPLIGLLVALRLWRSDADVYCVESGNVGMGTMVLRACGRRIVSISHSHGLVVAIGHLRGWRSWSPYSLLYLIGQLLYFSNEILDNFFSHRVIYLTENACELWAKWGISRRKGVVVPYGIELGTFRPLPDRQYFDHAGGQPVQVLYVGHLQTIRNIPSLIEAVRALRSRGIDISLQLAGGGELERSIGQNIREQGLTNIVQMYGVIRDDNRIADIIRAATMVVLPHNPGSVFLQVLACGTPILTVSNSIGYSEVVPEELLRCAIVVEKADVASLCDGILQVLADPTTAARARQGALLCRGYSWKATTDSILKVLSLVASRG